VNSKYVCGQRSLVLVLSARAWRRRAVSLR